MGQTTRPTQRNGDESLRFRDPWKKRKYAQSARTKKNSLGVPDLAGLGGAITRLPPMIRWILQGMSIRQNCQQTGLAGFALSV
jgi:hypothetical protein